MRTRESQPGKEKGSMGSPGGRRCQSSLAARAKGRHNGVAPLLCVRDLQTQDKWQGHRVSSRGNKLRSSTRQELIRRGIHWQLEAWRRLGVKIWSTCMQPASRSVALHWRHVVVTLWVLLAAARDPAKYPAVHRTAPFPHKE